MIQRVQTLFLLAVAGFLSAILFLPMWREVSTLSGDKATLNSYELTYVNGNTGEVLLQQPTYYIAIVIGLSIAVAIWSIFMYKNRLMQVKLGMINSLIMAAALGLSLYFIMKSEPLVVPTQQGEYEIGFYMFIGSMISNLLANRFIRKDEKLVRSVDRLR